MDKILKMHTSLCGVGRAAQRQKSANALRYALILLQVKFKKLQKRKHLFVSLTFDLIQAPTGFTYTCREI